MVRMFVSNAPRPSCGCGGAEAERAMVQVRPDGLALVLNAAEPLPLPSLESYDRDGSPVDPAPRQAPVYNAAPIAGPVDAAALAAAVPLPLPAWGG